MRMHCPGDENIIPLYRPEDTTTDLDTSTSKTNDTAENATETQVSVAAPKSDVTSEEKRRLIREEKESRLLDEEGLRRRSGRLAFR